MYRRLRCTRLAPLSSLQVQDEATPFAGSGDVIRIVAETAPINQAVLVILVLFSIASWAIILQKFWTFRASDRDTTRVSSTSSAAAASSRKCRPSARRSPARPLVGVFQAGYAEMNAQFRVAAPAGAASTAVHQSANRSDASNSQEPRRRRPRADPRRDDEVNKLEHRMTFLATTASVTPFIGLFGTVVGIMIAFQRIGATRLDEPGRSSRPASAKR